MAMSKDVAMGSCVIGCALLVLTVISVICGAVAMSRLTSPASVSIGLWGSYFAIPGVLSSMAGFEVFPITLGFALGAHIFGIFLAIGGMSYAATFWAILNSNCIEVFDCCVCYHTRLSIHSPYTDAAIYEATCYDLKIVRNATGVVTIIFALCGIVSFIGSIYGCIATCCAPEPNYVVPVVGPTYLDTVAGTSAQQQSQAYSVQPLRANSMQSLQAYGMQPPHCNQSGAVG